ncbi:MAG: 5'-3' exonuclease H3TH domain-containing protein [Microgenomates group bacterium]
MSQGKFLIIDGNNLFHRAYHALPPLTTKDGLNSNAVYGFSNMLLKAIAEVQPQYIACAFDTKAPTFRHVEFEGYKAQRKAPPEDLYPQLPKIKSVLGAFGIVYFEKEGYEADDLLGTLTAKALSQVEQIIILTGDRDALQLVNGKVKVQMPGWNLASTSLFGSAEVKEKYGLTPAQMIDYKSLIGDASDNIPGIAGIGPKTASVLLNKYETLENLYEHVGEVDLKIREKLESGKHNALAAKSLVEIDCDVDIDFDLERLEFKPDWNQVRNEYIKLGFKSIVAKIDADEGTKVPQVKDSGGSGASEEGLEESDSSDQLKLI